MASPSPKLVDRTAQQQQAANLAILQRKDEAVSEILATATYVVMYLYDAGSKQWTRKEIEGSLFVVKRSFGCRFRLIILNRMSNQDLEEDLTASVSIEEMDPYLLYRTTSSTQGAGATALETHAIWFHNAKERSAIYNCLRRVLRSQSTVEQLEKKEGGGSTSSSSTTNGGKQAQGAGTAASSTTPTLLQPQQLLASKAQSDSTSEVSTMSMTLKDLLLKDGAKRGTTDTTSTTNGDGGRSASAANGSIAGAPPSFSTDTEPSSSTSATGPALLRQLLLKKSSPSATTTTSPAIQPPLPPASQTGSLLLSSLKRQQQPQQQQQQQQHGGVVLDKEQLKATLLDLIQDDSFIGFLHGAYLSKLRREGGGAGAAPPKENAKEEM